MSKVIGIGSAVADTLLEVEKYPAEDTKLEAKKVRRQCGGPCATALVAVSKLGLDAEYLGTLGDDSNGQYIREQLERFGVRTDCVRMAEGTASFSSVVLLNEASASRTCIWNRGNAPEPELSDVPDGKFSEADILHLDGHHHRRDLCGRQIHPQNMQLPRNAGSCSTGFDHRLRRFPA